MKCISHFCSYLKFCIYRAGGIGCEGVDRGQSRCCLDAVEIYNTDSDFWRDGPPLPWPLLSLRNNAPNAGVVDGKLYICGYYKGAGKYIVPCFEGSSLNIHLAVNAHFRSL